MSVKIVRTGREPLKKPRPLKTTSSSEHIKFQVQDSKDTLVYKSKNDILADLEGLNISISNCNFDEATAADISKMYAIFKKRGEELDSSHKEAVDRYFCTLRNAVREERLDIVSRLKLLEVIESRAMGWQTNENFNNYYHTRIQENEQGIDHHISGSTSPSISYPLQNQNLPVASGIPLAPGEILRSSGKFAKPTKIAGKNYFKDEIVIRNSDSGKVMGIKGRRVHMIEELSDTVISFQRVNPGARDRLVQITGPREEAIGHAKLLVEDTIRRNASPIRENVDTSELGMENKEHSEFGTSYPRLDNQSYVKKQLVHSYSMSDASFKEFCLPVYIGDDVIKLSGTKSELLKTAKLVLTEYFAGQTELQEKHYESLSSMSIQSPLENSVQRFELQRQSSLRKNILESFSSSKINDSSKRESISPLSSSDDDVGKEDVNNGLERVKAIQDLPSRVSVLNAMNDIKSQTSVPIQISNAQDKFNQKPSIHKDFSSFDSFSDSQEHFKEEVLSPLLAPSPTDIPIPPPSYKKKSYSREFLLNCANSPFSHNQPADYVHIHQNFQDIICKSPVMFDPSKYREKEPQFEDSSSGMYK